MSISVPFVSQWEALLSTFMDKVLDKNFSSKAELVSLWNHTIGNPISEVNPVTTKPVESSKPVETVKPVPAEAKPVASKANATCPFVITRGDKMGEKCGSGLRPGMNYCMKHNKDKPKVPEKETTTDDEKSSVKSVKSSPIIKSTDPTREKTEKTEKIENLTSSQKLEQEFKRREQQKKLMITETIGGNTIIKGTMVVVNAQQQIIGYLQDKTVVHGTSAEVEKASKEYSVQINRSQWKVHIDELSI